MAIEYPDYSAGDFKQATAALLPPGEYWQYEKNDELDLLLSAVGEEFKKTHDEIQINILNQGNNIASGWKISDYQTLLNSNYIVGTVYDNSATPNLIYIDMSANQTAGGVIKSLDEYRLPHTAFCCTVKHQKTMVITLLRRSITINTRTLKASK